MPPKRKRAATKGKAATKKATPAKKAKKVDRPATPTPDVKLARTRVYDIEREDNTHYYLKNKDGMPFSHKKAHGDMITIAQYTKKETISLPSAITLLGKKHGFLWIRFKLVKGGIRDMYAQILACGPTYFDLKDLLLTDAERRRCKYENLMFFIVDGTCYRVKQ